MKISKITLIIALSLFAFGCKSQNDEAQQAIKNAQEAAQAAQDQAAKTMEQANKAVEHAMDQAGDMMEDAQQKIAEASATPAAAH